MFPRQLAPFPAKAMQQLLDRFDSLFLVDMSQGQLHTFLRSQIRLPEQLNVYERPGAAPFTLQEILTAFDEVKAQ